MATARKQQISLVDTPYYHCVSRCVRRAYLCGEDKFTGQSYEHRRAWVADKLQELSDVFAIDVCAYVVMSNHTHLVLFIDEQQAKSWSMHEVISRWHQLFKGTLLTQQYLRGEPLIDTLQQVVEQTAKVYRQRLMDISWFMRILNETIAKQANREDGCTGRFWEGRFKSQALLDDAALIACMAYVDLNPIRAKSAKTPETSNYTSIQRRIQAAVKGKQAQQLLPFIGNPRKNMPTGLPFELSDYIQLLDLTGRCIRADKRGYIDKAQPEILSRLGISTQNWLVLTTQFRQCFHGAVGRAQVLTDFCEHQHLKKRATVSICQKLLA
ncbi:transposase [Colwellia sp. MT41]|uniref:transposase n=1 Tax=Colwellia sp. MT41 TaxID=58049 RepID=UPI000717901D|nr:transposase [Colwellia sp. MT41]ALO35647.1 transposase [Colwellia sp. MT41]